MEKHLMQSVLMNSNVFFFSYLMLVVSVKATYVNKVRRFPHTNVELFSPHMYLQEWRCSLLVFATLW